MRIRFVCPHCKVARTWASSRVLAGHYLASQTQVAMLMYCTTIILESKIILVWNQNLFGVH